MMGATWPPELLAWMQVALQKGFTPLPDDGPDFDELRREANASWALATARHLSEWGE
jgi:hypothetical protein